MKANDIRPGVLYAYGAGQYDNYDLVVITGFDSGTPLGNGDTRFPAIRIPARSVNDEVIDAVTHTVAGDLGSAMSRVLVKAGMYADLVSNRLVRGEWTIVMAERSRLRAAIAQRAAAEQAIRDEESARQQDRWTETAGKLGAYGIPVVPGGGWDDDDYTTFQIDQETADKLIARLGGAR